MKKAKWQREGVLMRDSMQRWLPVAAVALAHNLSK